MSIEVFYPEEGREVDVDLRLNLDIVAIHGLNGNPIRTWTEHASQRLWLRDFLPSDLPKARVMTFGYDATAAFANSKAEIVDHARDLLECLAEKRRGENEVNRPLILIGHSLGGLVTKQALIIASKESHHQSIYNSTAGIIFFGTPHQGSGFASYALFFLKIPTAVAFKPDPLLLKALKVGSKVLRDLTEDFSEHHQKRRYPIVSFYETKTMTGMKTLIVEKASAILNLPHDHSHDRSHEQKIPVPADHKHMCQFSTVENQTYKRALDAIKRLYSTWKEIRSVEKNEHYLVPDKLNTHFTGRDEIRQRLQECLLRDPYAEATQQQQRFVLFGLGGSGKTQIAMRFASDCRNRFRSIFWIDATTSTTASESFISIARACSLERTVDAVKSWLSGQDYCLLIIDNADDPQMDIANYFPSGSRSTILITTRNPDFQQYGSAGSWRVDELVDEDAITLLLRTCQAEDLQNSETRQSAGKMVKALGNLALAIVQAGAVVRQGICSLDGFLELYSHQRKRLLESGRSIANTRDYEHSVYTTWEVSLQKIEKMDDPCAGLALELLRLFSFMHFEDINLNVFERARASSEVVDNSHAGNIYRGTMLAKLMVAEWDPILIRQSLKLLIAFSLVSMDGAQRISMHPLVHEWSRDRMDDKDRATARLATASTLAMSIPMDYSDLDVQYRGWLHPHIDACLDGDHKQLYKEGPDIQERLSMATKFALVYKDFGRLDTAIDLQLEILERKKVIFPLEHHGRLTTMEHVACLYSGLGQHQQALELRETVLQVLKTMEDEGSLDVLWMMCAVAQSYIQRKDIQKGIDRSIEAYTTSERFTGKDSLITLHALSLVGLANVEKGDLGEAARRYELLLEAQRRRSGYSVTTAATMEKMAAVYQDLGDYKKARTLHEDSLALVEKTLGKDHPETIRVLANLVAWHVDNVFFKKIDGIRIRTEAVQRLKAALGKNAPQTLVAIGSLAQSHFSCGELQEARRLNQISLEGLSATLGKDNPYTIRAAETLKTTNKAIAIRAVFLWWVPKRLQVFLS